MQEKNGENKMFNEGDKIRDKKFNEVFSYESKRDFLVIENEPDRFELVQEE